MDVKSLIALSIIKSLGLLSLSGARRFGRFIGWMLIRTNSRAYRVTLKNLEICFPDMPDDERHNLAKDSIVQTATTLAETGIAWGGTEAKFARNAKMIKRVENIEVFDDALAHDQGVLILTPHIGNWEVLSCWLPQRCNLMALYKMAKMPGLEKAMLDARESSGATLVAGNRGGIKKLLDHYVNGGTAMILPDQEPSERSGVWAKFYGIDALTPKIVHSMIQKNPRGRVVLAYLLRTDDGFNLVFRQPLADIYSDEVAVSATAMNQSIEQCISDDLSQYQWEYKRFKRNKEGFYKGL